jgi:vacuolar iron transporter family protein
MRALLFDISLGRFQHHAPTSSTLFTMAAEVATFEAAQREHARFNSGWLRASIFGLSDGVVSILALELGVFASEGSAGDPRKRLRNVALAGISGILAGASSMAVGEWVSVITNAEALRAQIEVERRHLRHFSAREGELFTARLSSSYGVDRAVAQALLHNLARREDEAANEAALDRQTDLHVRILSGLDPLEQGSPFTAAWTSFCAFLLGGGAPTIPWLIAAYGSGGLSESAALGISIAVAASLLAALGALIKLSFTYTAQEVQPGDSWWRRVGKGRWRWPGAPPARFLWARSLRRSPSASALPSVALRRGDVSAATQRQCCRPGTRSENVTPYAAFCTSTASL